MKANLIPCEEKKITIRQKRKYTRELLIENLREVKWDLQNDVNEDADFFVRNMTDVVNEIMPVKQITLKNTCEWYTEGLRQLRKERDELYRAFKLTGKTEIWLKYKKLRNKYSKDIKIQKNEYIKKRIQISKNNPSKMWLNIKYVLKGKKADPIAMVDFPDGTEDNFHRIANKFNQNFITSVESIDNSIKLCNNKECKSLDLVKPAPCEFKFKLITNVEELKNNYMKAIKS
jgi:hypothetical protein